MWSIELGIRDKFVEFRKKLKRVELGVILVLEACLASAKSRIPSSTPYMCMYTFKGLPVRVKSASGDGSKETSCFMSRLLKVIVSGGQMTAGKYYSCTV